MTGSARDHRLAGVLRTVVSEGVGEASGALHRRIPNLQLILAGTVRDDPFREFGVAPANLRGLLGRASDRLGLPRDRVRIMRPVQPDQLRLLYNIADLKVNLTLHHDENFGLA